MLSPEAFLLEYSLIIHFIDSIILNQVYNAQHITISKENLRYKKEIVEITAFAATGPLFFLRSFLFHSTK